MSARRVYSTSKIRDFCCGRCPYLLSDGHICDVAAAAPCPGSAPRNVGEVRSQVTFFVDVCSDLVEEMSSHSSGFAFESLGKMRSQRFREVSLRIVSIHWS